MSRDTVAWVVWMPTRPRRATSSSWVAIWCLAIKERIASCRLRFNTGKRLLDLRRRRPAKDVARFQRALQRQVAEHVAAEERRKLLQLVEGEILESFVGSDSLRDHLTDHAVGVAKRHALTGQIVRGFGRQRVTGQRGCAHDVAIEFE